MVCEQNGKMSVKVQSVEEEEEELEEESTGYTVFIMGILFSASIKLLCYFYVRVTVHR
jgi:hypothetical protein